MGLWALLLGAALAGPSHQDRVYYNARLALRDDEPALAVKLWLLRNALEDQTLQVSQHDADFRSLTWAALGQIGLCPDGLGKDTEGAGVWPLAVHNWVLRNRSGRRPAARQATFGALTVDRQQRHVAIGDVLDAGELDALDLQKGHCLGPHLEKTRAGLWPWDKLSDRRISATFLRHLVEEAQRSLDADRVRGRSVLAARLFDLDLVLAGLAEREAQRRARSQRWEGRRLGLGDSSLRDMASDAPESTLDPTSRAAAVLRGSASWPASEWMALSPERRRYLFDRARAFGVDPAALDQVALDLVDAHLLLGDGDEVTAWIARASGPDSASRSRVWAGPRGASLLALPAESGFREASVIALHRGIAALETGQLDAALRAFAVARQRADSSREAAAVASLSRRWLAHLAAQFAITDGLLTTLRALLPRRDFTAVLEDLLWGAAWRADAASFAKGQEAAPARSAADRRVALLAPLSRGDAGALVRGVSSGLQRDPAATLRFTDELVQRLEREDARTRQAHVGTARALSGALDRVGLDPSAPPRFVRRAAAQSQRLMAVVEGLDGLPAEARLDDRARAMAPEHRVYGGVVRLAPSDPLPWPFEAAPAPPPSAFEPIALTPVEWRDAGGALVFGWAIGR